MVVLILCVQNPVIPERCLKGHREGGKKKMGVVGSGNHSSSWMGLLLSISYTGILQRFHLKKHPSAKYKFANHYNLTRIQLLHESLSPQLRICTVSNQFFLIIWQHLVNLMDFLARKHHIGIHFFLQV